MKTAKELGLSELTRAGLIITRNNLASGRIKDAEFDMHNFTKPCRVDRSGKECGTAHCIGGWVEAYTGETGLLNQPTNKGNNLLKRLYYPTTGSENNYRATREQAVKVLDRVLTKGRVPKNWRVL